MNDIVEQYTVSAPTLHITDSAAKKLHELFLAEGNADLKLRISIDGGGCSGFQYDFAFETEKKEDDYTFSKQMEDYQVAVVVDAMCFMYLQNATVDYEENFQESKFIIRNPNAKTTCGCGSSFSVE